MNTKKIFTTAVCFLYSLVFLTLASAQEKQLSNRYAMKLKDKGDGTYELLYGYKYARFIDLSKLDDLLVPYEHQNDKLSGKLYNKIETEVVTYKKHEGYELQLPHDKATRDGPTADRSYRAGDGGGERGQQQCLPPPVILGDYVPVAGLGLGQDAVGLKDQGRCLLLSGDDGI